MGFGDARSRADQVARPNQRVELSTAGLVEEFDVEFCGSLATGGCDVVIGDDDLDAVALQCPNGCSTGHREPVDQRSTHGMLELISVKSPMKMASAVATQIAEINQKRMITVVSGQPMSSK